jgi:hypothetical protein
MAQDVPDNGEVVNRQGPNYVASVEIGNPRVPGQADLFQNADAARTGNES